MNRQGRTRFTSVAILDAHDEPTFFAGEVMCTQATTPSLAGNYH